MPSHEGRPWPLLKRIKEECRCLYMRFAVKREVDQDIRIDEDDHRYRFAKAW